MSGSFVKVPGTTIEIGDKRYVMPPLSLGAIEQLGDRFGDLSSEGNSPAKMKLVVDMIHAALCRNYPDMTRAEVADGLDLSTLQPALAALLKTSGLSREEQDPEPPSGEA